MTFTKSNNSKQFVSKNGGLDDVGSLPDWSRELHHLDFHLLKKNMTKKE